MTALLITALLCLAFGISSSLLKKKEAKEFRTRTRGSRVAEIEEWDRWSEALLYEYNRLTGFNISYPIIQFRSDNPGRAYYIAFSGLYELATANRWKDLNAIETLRLKYNLPSDDELYALDEWMYNKKILSRPPRYTNLADVISKCVHRAVNGRGYKYGGTDYDGQEAARLKWKEIEVKHGWLKNDPTERDN
jgi:hypothetical protein